MSLLEVEGLGKRFGANEVLRDLDLAIEPGEIVGLVALNGAGKTTLVNALFGVYRKDVGDVRFRGRTVPDRPGQVVRMGLARTFQNVRMPADMTAREVLAATLAGCRAGLLRLWVGRGRAESVSRSCDRLLDQFELRPFADSPAAALPFAMQRRLDVARALATAPKMLFLDEPAAGASAAEEDDLALRIRRLRDEQGITVFVIDHRLRFLFRLVDRLVFMHRGQIVADSAPGAPEDLLEHPTVRKVYATRSGAAAAGDTGVGDEGNGPEGLIALEVRDLHVQRGTIPAVRGVSLTVRKGEWLAISGPNGAGKTTLLESLAGILPASSGAVLVDGQPAPAARLYDRQVTVLVPEGREVVPTLTVAENLRLGAFHLPAGRSWRRLLEERSAWFPRIRDHLDEPAGLLSGGEQQILAVMRASLADARVVLMDEATAGLAPRLGEVVFGQIRDLAAGGLAILSSEQQVDLVTPYVTDVLTLERGRLVPGGNEADEPGSARGQLRAAGEGTP